MKKVILNLISTFCLLIIGLNGWSSIDPNHPTQQKLRTSDTRYTIQVIESSSKAHATEEAIYISSFLNLTVFIIAEKQNYSIYTGVFSNQFDAPHYLAQLKQSGFRKASIKIKKWDTPEEIVRFNNQYIRIHDIPETEQSKQMNSTQLFSKKIGEQPEPKEILWISVPDAPELEHQLREGWLHINNNEYESACRIFNDLRSNDKIKAKATYGLASCFHRSLQPEKAIPLYRELLVNDKQVEQILIPLAEDLESTNQQAEATVYRKRHENLTKDYWRGYQIQEAFKIEVDKSINNKDNTQLLDVLKQYEALLIECNAVDGFYNAANHLRRNNKKDEAKVYYKKLMKYCPKKWHLKVGLIYSLSAISKFEDTKKQIISEKKLQGAPDHYIKRLNQLQFNLYLRHVDSLSQGSPEAYKYLSELNKRYPNNHKVLASLGWWHYENKDYSEALKHLESSHNQQKTKDTERGILFTLIQMGDKNRALTLAGSAKYKKIELALIKELFGQLDIEDPKIPEMAKDIYDLDPTYLPSQKTLAWHFYEVEDYKHSKLEFSRLHQTYPEDINLLKGYVYTLMKLGEIDHTETILETNKNTDQDFSQLASDIYMDKSLSFYKQKQYSESLDYINKYLDLQPESKDALALRSWIYFHKNERASAIQDLKSVWQSDPSADNTKSLLFLYHEEYKNNPNSPQYIQFLEDLKKSKNTEMSLIASSELAKQKQPITASQITKDTKTPFNNADATNIHITAEYRTKSGDKGTSKLESIGVFAGVDFFTLFGNQWRLQLGQENLKTGDLPSSPFIGRAFLLGDPGQPHQTPETSLPVKRMWLQHWSETGIIKYGAIGTTALNSIIKTLPVFELEGSFSTDPLKLRSNSYWNIHQRSVDESLLSYVGQKDPYTNEEWGRVLKTGAKIGNQWNLTPPFWVNASIGGDYYWGENIWENWSIDGNASVGKTEQFNNHQRSLGLYGHISHYDKNTNHYTFGHGGYYSPQFLVGGGPFAAWEALTQNTSFWWKIETSLGAYWETMDNAPLYPEDTNDVRAEGEYSSESNFGVGAQIKLQYRKLWNSYIETSGLIDWRKSPDYDEARIQATLRVYFEPRNALTVFDVFDRIDLP